MSNQEDLGKTVAVAGGVYKVVVGGARFVEAVEFFVAEPEGEGADVVDLGVGTGVGELGESERLAKSLSKFDQLNVEFEFEKLQTRINKNKIVLIYILQFFAFLRHQETKFRLRLREFSF